MNDRAIAASVVTFQEEAFGAVLPELQVHWDAHYREGIRDQAHMPLNVDIATYLLLEAQGVLCLVTLRVDGAVQGYIVATCYPHFHHATVRCADVLGYYVAPMARRGWTGVHLFQALETQLQARGVQKVFADTNVWLDIGPLLRRRGWDLVSMKYAKWIGEN
jgi:GNAT superfamily N-acetyltransferase